MKRDRRARTVCSKCSVEVLVREMGDHLTWHYEMMRNLKISELILDNESLLARLRSLSSLEIQTRRELEYALRQKEELLREINNRGEM